MEGFTLYLTQILLSLRSIHLSSIYVRYKVNHRETKSPSIHLIPHTDTT